MRFAILFVGALLFLSGGQIIAAESIPSYVSEAVNDRIRTADKPADPRRHIAELAAFAQIKPGDTVVELVPGGGYFTRVFSRIVGPKGHVYALWPKEYAAEGRSDIEALQVMGRMPEYNNVEVIIEPAAEFKSPKPIDVMFTSQNYHDYPDKFMGHADLVTFGKQVYAALKPGGVFIVIDHAAEAGSGLRDTEKLHRIDPARTRELVEAAGFKFDGESDVLRNPADDHTKLVFDDSIRGHTDQFAYRFRKPR